MLLLAFLILLQTPQPQARWGSETKNPPTDYVDVHGNHELFSVRKLCPRGQHIHLAKSQYPVYDKNHKNIPVMKPGDGKCHEDANDLVAKPH